MLAAYFISPFRLHWKFILLREIISRTGHLGTHVSDISHQQEQFLVVLFNKSLKSHLLLLLIHEGK